MGLELERISSEMMGFHALAYMDLVEFELGNWDFEPVLLHEPLPLSSLIYLETALLYSYTFVSQQDEVKNMAAA